MTETGQSDEAAGMSRDLWPFPPHSAPQRPEGPETPHGSCPVETKDAKKSSQGKYFWHSAPCSCLWVGLGLWAISLYLCAHTFPFSSPISRY